MQSMGDCPRREMIMNITRDQAKRFILSKQGLLGRYRFAGKNGAYQYVRQAGCIQFDPVDVCGRNAELTLQSRVKGFTKQMLAELLYQDRVLVDYSDKELSIWPREDWPYFSGYRERSRALGQRFSGIPELEDVAIEYIREHGPVSSDTLPIEGEIFWHSSMHWSGHWHRQSKAARSVLEQLYADGVLLIHHKSGSRKFYDLAEKYFDRTLLQAECPCSDDESFLRWRILRRIGAVGMLWNRRSDAWLGIQMTTEQRNQAFAELASAGTVTPVQVEGLKEKLYILSDDIPRMEAVLENQIDIKARLEFLAPLDPMLWDRKLISALWDYQYSWEIYTPVEKRKYGYYVLPVLYGQNLIGRMEAVANRQNSTLDVKNIWYESGIKKTKKLDAALSAAIGRLAAFNDCDRINRNETALDGGTVPDAEK